MLAVNLYGKVGKPTVRCSPVPVFHAGRNVVGLALGGVDDDIVHLAEAGADLHVGGEGCAALAHDTGVLGIGAGSIDVALNNYVALHYSATHMSFLHCFYGVGVSVSPYPKRSHRTSGHGA